MYLKQNFLIKLMRVSLTDLRLHSEIGHLHNLLSLLNLKGGKTCMQTFQ